MDPATITTIIHVTRKVVKYGKITIDYIRDDQTAKLGLLRPVRFCTEGPGVGIGDFESPDHRFRMRSPNINRVDFSFSVFPADAASWWNGPDFLPNDIPGGALPSSLPHDAICKFIKQIADELGISEDEVWVWATGILASVWEAYGGDGIQTKAEVYAAYNAIRPSRRIYRWFKRRLGFASLMFVAALASAGCDSGCFTPPPPWRTTVADPVVWVEAGVVSTNAPPAVRSID